MKPSVLTLLAFLVAEGVCAQAGDGRIYVRRIEFVGADGMSDSVLRSRMLQLEGAHVNTAAFERSARRLERLAYVESAAVRLRPVAGVSDQADVVVTITAAPARRWSVGGAWSEAAGGSLNATFVNENVFGGGNRIATRLDLSEIRTAIDLSHTNPFVGRSDVSRTLALQLRDADRLTLDASELDSRVGALRLEYQYPVAEQQSVQLGLGLQAVDLAAGTTISDQLLDWISRNGDTNVGGTTAGTDYLTADLLAGWRYDTRDAPIFPEQGTRHLLRLRATLPGSEIGYATLDYRFDTYRPLAGGWIASVRGHVGYGTHLGSDTTALPPNLNWFAGGFRSVRGYRESSLGPKDSLSNPWGGDLLTAAQFELIAPLPEKWRARARLSLFYDVGNVFSTGNTVFLDQQGEPLDFDFDISGLRQSFGVAARFRLPFGVLGISYGVPIDADDHNPDPFLRDEIERVQVTLGLDF